MDVTSCFISCWGSKSARCYSVSVIFCPKLGFCLHSTNEQNVPWEPVLGEPASTERARLQVSPGLQASATLAMPEGEDCSLPRTRDCSDHRSWAFMVLGCRQQWRPWQQEAHSAGSHSAHGDGTRSRWNNSGLHSLRSSLCFTLESTFLLLLNQMQGSRIKSQTRQAEDLLRKGAPRIQMISEWLLAGFRCGPGRNSTMHQTQFMRHSPSCLMHLKSTFNHNQTPVWGIIPAN